MHKIIFILSFTVLGLSGFGQNKTYDKLEMLYDQGNYKKVYKKSDKLLRTDTYKNSPQASIFHAISEYQLAKTSKRYSKSSAILDYENFLPLDPSGKYRKMYDIYIYDMQLGIVNEIRDLEKQGKDESAKIKYNTYERLFGNAASYEMITKDEPIIESTSTSETTSSSRNDLVKYAKKYLGVPYKYGGMDKKGFDCSGYSQYVMANNGYKLPRTAQAQSEYQEKIKISDARKGDLVFFGSSKRNINHVGIVVSDKGEDLTMIHASSSRGIMISNIENDTYWHPKLQLATRIIND